MAKQKQWTRPDVPARRGRPRKRKVVEAWATRQPDGRILLWAGEPAKLERLYDENLWAGCRSLAIDGLDVPAGECRQVEVSVALVEAKAAKAKKARVK